MIGVALGALAVAILTPLGAWALSRPSEPSSATATPAGPAEAPAEAAAAGAQELPAPAGGAPPQGGLQDLLGGGQAGIVGAGLAVSALAGEAVARLGGSELEQNLSRLSAAQLGIPIAVGLGVEKALEALGVGNETTRNDVGQAVAVGVVSTSLLPAFAAVKVGQKLVKVFGGSDPEPPALPLGELFSPGELRRLAPPAATLARLTTATVERKKTLAFNWAIPGTHVVRVRVSSSELWDEPALFRILVNGVAVTLDVPAVGAQHRGQWQEHFARVALDSAAAPETIAIAFPNAQWAPGEGYNGYRTLWCAWLSIDGDRYVPAEGMYYREELEPIKGQDGMHWRGVLMWELKPEHRSSGRARRATPNGAEQAAAQLSTRFV